MDPKQMGVHSEQTNKLKANTKKIFIRKLVIKGLPYIYIVLGALDCVYKCYTYIYILILLTTLLFFCTKRSISKAMKLKEICEKIKKFQIYSIKIL